MNSYKTEHTDKTFIWPYGVCSYMKKNSLINTLEALIDPRPDQVVTVDGRVAVQATKAIENTFELAK